MEEETTSLWCPVQHCGRSGKSSVLYLLNGLYLCHEFRCQSGKKEKRDESFAQTLN
uniref:Uncharacterized protein n=1 Tax=Setaria italica TaxID=4555 RepID=K3XP78_SETIT